MMKLSTAFRPPLLLMLACAPYLAEARDRPAPPTDVFVGLFDTAIARPPLLRVSFRNGASERVGFLLEWTRNGQAMSPDLSDHVRCVSGSAQEYRCEAMYWFVKGRYAPHYIHERGAIEGFLMPDADFDTDYCFRFMAITDSGVISGSWSGWACTHTPPPPPAPPAPQRARATFLPGNDGSGRVGDATPARQLLEWSSPENGYIANFTVLRFDRTQNRWFPTEKRISASTGKVNFEVTFDLPPDAVDATALMLMSVCAQNAGGTTCTNAQRPFASVKPRVAAEQGSKYADIVGTRRAPESITESASKASAYGAIAQASSTTQLAKSKSSIAGIVGAASTPPSTPAPPLRDSWPHVVYSVTPAGELQWSSQISAAARFTAAQTVANDWGAFAELVPGGRGTLYAIASDGVLKWYRHDGYRDGSARMTGPVDVSTGWNAFTKVFAGGDGVLYGTGADGSLHWYRHNDAAEAATPPRWSGPTVVGTGWNSFVQVFSMSGGIIYGVTPDGKLLWYRHKGYLTGTKDWEGPKQVGTGWSAFKELMSPGPGQIVAVNANGELVQYQHDGYVDGTFRWRGPTIVSEAGWLDAAHVFPAIQNSVP